MANSVSLIRKCRLRRVWPMRAFLITALSEIEMKEPLGRGDRLTDDTFLTNDLTCVMKELTPDFRLSIGGLETDFICNAPAVVYSNREIADSDELPKLLHGFMAVCVNFLQFLWLVKDHSVNLGMLFGKIQQPGFNRFDSTYYPQDHFTGDGTRKTTEFSRSELQLARRITRTSDTSRSFVASGSSIAVQDRGRVERSTYFLSAARGSADLGLRVAYYCSAFEAMFASSTQELSHQLAERAAAFLVDDPESRLEIYRRIKKAYSVRSQVVHGGRVKPSKQADFRQASLELDDLFRRAFRKWLTDKTASAALSSERVPFEDVCLLRVFGAPWQKVLDFGTVAAHQGGESQAT